MLTSWLRVAGEELSQPDGEGKGPWEMEAEEVSFRLTGATGQQTAGQWPWQVGLSDPTLLARPPESVASTAGGP